MNLKIYPLLILSILLLSTQAFCEWGRTADDYFRLPLGPGPKIISDGNGGCWVAANPVGLCHVDRDGNLTWGNEPFNIPPTTSYDPKLVLADNGDVILAMDIVYEEDNPQKVYLQRFNLDQEYQWGEGGILNVIIEILLADPSQSLFTGGLVEYALMKISII